MGRKSAELAGQRLAAIVASSDDAILSKDIKGINLEPRRVAPLLPLLAESDEHSPGVLLSR